MSRVVVGELEVVRLSFPPSSGHGVVDPSRGYLAFVVDGAVCKTFPRASTTLSCGSIASIPAGAAHSSSFGDRGCTVLVIRGATGADSLLGSLVACRTEARAGVSTSLGLQLVRELERPDSYSGLAVEGLALELLACAGRAVEHEAPRGPWVEAVRELIHDATPRVPSLQELGTAVGRHPAQVARAFRVEHGLGVGAYARALRLEWATNAVVSTADPLARIAADAGFADQSHFTRWFKRHHGSTPGRYRRRFEP
jgi:AraC family transcriptional regulator